MDQHHQPLQWRYRYPVTPAEKRQWIMLGIAIPLAVIFLIAISPTTVVIVGGVATLCVFALRALGYLISLWANTGIMQICPQCFGERPAGYTTCGFCGFTSEEKPSCVRSR